MGWGKIFEENQTCAAAVELDIDIRDVIGIFYFCGPNFFCWNLSYRMVTKIDIFILVIYEKAGLCCRNSTDF